MSIQLSGFEFMPSEKKNKKYDVYRNGQFITSFGAIKENGEPYTQYFDKIGIYKDYDNNDKIKRANYKKRHQKDRLKKYSAGWFADQFLW
jgi:hypothetical protein